MDSLFSSKKFFNDYYDSFVLIFYRFERSNSLYFQIDSNEYDSLYKPFVEKDVLSIKGSYASFNIDKIREINHFCGGVAGLKWLIEEIKERALSFDVVKILKHWNRNAKLNDLPKIKEDSSTKTFQKVEDEISKIIENKYSAEEIITSIDHFFEAVKDRPVLFKKKIPYRCNLLQYLNFNHFFQGFTVPNRLKNCNNWIDLAVNDDFRAVMGLSVSSNKFEKTFINYCRSWNCQSFINPATVKKVGVKVEEILISSKSSLTAEMIVEKIIQDSVSSGNYLLSDIYWENVKNQYKKSGWVK